MEDRTCANCVFYNATEDDSGECRQKSPQVVGSETVSNYTDGSQSHTTNEFGYPPTEANSSCGKHQA